MYVCPVIIIVLSIVTLVNEGMQPAEMFFLLCQVGTIAWFELSFRRGFNSISKYMKESQSTVKSILDCCQEKGIIIKDKRNKTQASSVND